MKIALGAEFIICKWNDDDAAWGDKTGRIEKEPPRASKLGCSPLLTKAQSNGDLLGLTRGQAVESGLKHGQHADCCGTTGGARSGPGKKREMSRSQLLLSQIPSSHMLVNQWAF
jgi:hypothetical protein